MPPHPHLYPFMTRVEADLWDQLSSHRPCRSCSRLRHAALLYLQDEMQVTFHPTLTRLWSRKGRRRQRLVEAPGENRKTYGFGLVDWRDGWFPTRVRAVLIELQEHLRLVYTPAYDPDANRIEWLWRISRRVVTHHHLGDI